MEIGRALVDVDKRRAQTEGAIFGLTDFELEAREVHRRGRQEKLRHGCRDHRVAHRRGAGQHVVSRGAARLALDAEPGRGVALRIEIDDQHVFADGGERGAEIDRGRGLADAALLVGDRQHARACGLGAGGRCQKGTTLGSDGALIGVSGISGFPSVGGLRPGNGARPGFGPV